MTTVVLASASPARLAVLRAAGLDPRVLVSGVDEDAVLAGLAESATPHGRVAALAWAKARAVAATLAGEPDAVVLGCDSMLHLGGALLGKPGTAAVARQRWQDMRGSEATLLTGHTAILIRDGRIADERSATLATAVRFAEVTDAEIDAYVATGEPLAVAGAFTLDGYGGWFVESINGDPSNVLGISLPLVREMLARMGIPVASLWRAPR